LFVALRHTNSPTVFSKLRVNYGACHENPGEEGLAHFLEHCMMTAGSRKYSPKDSDEVRSKLGYSNAQTFLGRTSFVGDMLNEHLEDWLAFISDTTFNPRFDLSRVNGERGRIMREISDDKSKPAYEINRALRKAIYGDHPLSRYILGSEEVVKKADFRTLKQFHSRGYNATNSDLIIVGGFPDNIMDILEKYFASQKPGTDLRKTFPLLLPSGKSQVIRAYAPELENKERPAQSSAELCLNIVAVPDTHQDIFALRTLSNLLGHGSTSRLFKKMGLEKGLSYDQSADYQSGFNSGSIEIQAKVSSGRLEEAINVIFEEMNRVKTEGITSDELDSFRAQVEYSFARSLDSNDGKMRAIESEIDDGLTPQRWVEGFNSVTPKAILEVANKYLPGNRTDSGYVLGIRDPLKKD